MPEQKRAIKIIGAGISGLLAAYYAVERGFVVEVYEKSPEAGGKIHTISGKHGMMETAANALLCDTEVEAVAKTIGLRLVEKKPTARKRFIYADGKLNRWPLGFFSSLRLIGFLLKLRLDRNSVEPKDGETLLHWSQRVLNTQIEEQLLSPACQGIFGVGAQDLSARLIFNYFFSTTKRPRGSVSGSVAPEKGMGAWAEALERYLKSQGVKFSFGVSFEKKEPGDVLLICTDMPAAQNLLEKINDDRAPLLKTPQVSLLSINAFYTHKPLRQPEGFGVLFVKNQGFQPLGVLFNASIFPERVLSSAHSETWIFGSLRDDLTQKSENELLTAIRSTREVVWQDSQDPLESRINRWTEAIPLYGVELEKSLKQLVLVKNNIGLMGNYLGEIGLNRLFHRAKSLINQL